jgi:hypothetical protein
MLLGGPQNTIKSHLVFTALFCFAPFSVFFSRMSAPHCRIGVMSLKYLIMQSKYFSRCCTYCRTTEVALDFISQTRYNWTDKGVYVSKMPLPSNNLGSSCITFDPQEPFPVGYNSQIILIFKA